MIFNEGLEKNEMSDTDFKLFLVDKLMNNIGLSKEKAIYEAESMINKKRKVINITYNFIIFNNYFFSVSNYDCIQVLYFIYLSKYDKFL